MYVYIYICFIHIHIRKPGSGLWRFELSKGPSRLRQAITPGVEALTPKTLSFTSVRTGRAPSVGRALHGAALCMRPSVRLHAYLGCGSAQPYSNYERLREHC